MKTKQFKVKGVDVIIYPSGIAQVMAPKAQADKIMVYLVSEGFIENPLDMLVEA